MYQENYNFLFAKKSSESYYIQKMKYSVQEGAEHWKFGLMNVNLEFDLNDSPMFTDS